MKDEKKRKKDDVIARDNSTSGKGGRSVSSSDKGNKQTAGHSISQDQVQAQQLRNRKQAIPDYPTEEIKTTESQGKKKKKRRSRGQKPKVTTTAAPSATYYISAWLFGRFMGFLYITAFISAWVQIHGLIGSNGISPISEYFTRLSSAITSPANFLTHPSLFWLNQSDIALHIVCGIGTMSGMGLFIDIFPAFCSFLCWFLFLSICIAGQTFYMYQWDLLLLESGFLMIFFHSFHTSWKPFSQNPRDFHPPEALFWLFRLLLFRIHFMRGIQELLSRDRVWRTLSCFDYHFETQPSPTIISYYLHQIPSLFHQGMVFWVLTVEIGVVFLIFGPQLFRRTACLYLLLLQAFYMLTGNFGTYHWNVGGLCILLLDDAMFPNVIRKLTNIRRKKLQKVGKRKFSSSQPRLWHKRVSISLAVVLIVLTTVPLSSITKEGLTTPQPLRDVYAKVYPFKIVNLYGPFYRIPRERFELQIQASLDAQTWVEYSFLYKPDAELNRWPPFVSPHISRLEYQLWIAAQTDYQQEVWISRLLHRILEDSPSVVSLLRKEPFDSIPEYIRTVRLKYEFTEVDDKENWWKAEFHDIYTPSFSQTVHSMSNRRRNLRSRINLHSLK